MEQVMGKTEITFAKMPTVDLCKVSPAAYFLHKNEGKKNKQTALGWSQPLTFLWFSPLPSNKMERN